MNELEVTSLINAVLGNQKGEKLMDYLKDKIVDRPSYKSGMSLDEVAFREGQKDIVNQLLKELPNG